MKNKTEVFADYSAFLARTDRKLNGVSASFAESNPNYAQENETNEACWRCSGCSDCSRCSGCSDLKNARPVVQEADKSWFDVPVIPAIHQTVLRAATSKTGALKMDSWHSCTTTHCRGGWVVILAGNKGKALEAASSTLFAAMQIYRASSPIRVSPVRFFENDKVAMADIERCAAEEAAASASTP